ncbi:hypothetical protein [Nonlabens sp.]|uniref:hypothetical protein n=1 Tax=Nonlabens sp. TaxID=1888209 RepID=UPI003267A970
MILRLKCYILNIVSNEVASELNINFEKQTLNDDSEYKLLEFDKKIHNQKEYSIHKILKSERYPYKNKFTHIIKTKYNSGYKPDNKDYEKVTLFLKLNYFDSIKLKYINKDYDYLLNQAKKDLIKYLIGAVFGFFGGVFLYPQNDENITKNERKLVENDSLIVTEVKKIEKIEINKSYKSEVLIHSDSTNNLNHSKTFIQLLEKIKNDGYKIDTIQSPSSGFFSFDRVAKINDTIRSIIVPNVRKHFFSVKRKFPVNKEGNTYPRFTLSELYFNTENEAKNHKSSIDSIINCTNRIDLKNEKQYDYCVQFSNRIIYINCDSMYLSTFSNNYKSTIEELAK